ncbi:MAG: hypothetical protein ACKVHE_03115 [Planctomycetales bacterium]|jgi:hypothetical protein
MTFCRRTICYAAVLTASLSTLAMAADSWIDRQVVGHFQLRSEVLIRQSKVLSEFMQSLPQHESDIAATLGLRPNQKPIVINVFQSRRSYQEFMARSVPEGQRRRALFVRSETHGSVYAYHHADVMTDLRHETTHAILHSSLPFVPLWLDEGLAEYFEVAREHRASGNPHLRRAKLNARLILTWRPNLAKLEAVQDQAEMTTRNYRESWAWVHFLVHGPDAANSILTRYVAGIEAHDPPGPLSTQLQRVWSKPERQLTSHIKSWK